MKKLILPLFILLYPLLLCCQRDGSGYSLNFDGLDDEVSIPHDTIFNSDSFLTLEAWIKADQWAANSWAGSIINKDGWATSSQGYALRVGDNGKLSFVVGGGLNGNDWHEAISPSVMNTGEWYHIAGTFDGDTIRVFINGVEEASTPYSRTISGSTYNLTIGQTSYPVGGNRYFDGQIDEVRIWDTALTIEELRGGMCSKPSITNHPQYHHLIAYYNFESQSGSTLKDQGPHGKNGTLLNGPVWKKSTFPLGDMSAYIYGSSTKFSLTHPDGSSFGIDSIRGNPVGAHIYLVDTTPKFKANLFSGKMDDTRYYGTYIISNSAFDYAIHYDYGGNKKLDTLSNEHHLKFATRDSNTTLRWNTDNGIKVLDTTSNTIIKCGGETKNREFTLGTDSINPFKRSIRVCDSVFLGLKHKWQFKSKTFVDTFSSFYGCDSIRITELTVNKSYHITLPVITICEGDSALIDTVFQKTAGEYIIKKKTVSGCDSILKQQLMVNPSFSQTLPDITICDGSAALIFGKSESQGGIYTKFDTTYLGCDSIIFQKLIVTTPSSKMLPRQEICHGDSALIFGEYRKTAGTFKDTLFSFMGCDSIMRSQEISFYPNIDTTFLTPTSICKGDSILLFGTYQKNAGTYFGHLQSINGCDSIVSQQLDIRQVDTSITQTNDTLLANLDGASYQWLNCTNWSLVAGGTNRVYVPMASGNYGVEITENGCIDTSSCYTIILNPDGVNHLLFGEEIRIYPNPSKDKLYIDLGNTYDQITLKLFNSAGQEVKRMVGANDKSFIMNISKLPSGVYALTISTLGVTRQVEVVKLN